MSQNIFEVSVVQEIKLGPGRCVQLEWAVWLPFPPYMGLEVLRDVDEDDDPVEITFLYWNEAKERFDCCATTWDYKGPLTRDEAKDLLAYGTLSDCATVDELMEKRPDAFKDT